MFTQPYTVLLYYKYIPLSDPEQFAADQSQLCQRLQLKGRILVGQEGLNGTVSGATAACAQYKQALWADERFHDIEFKEHYYDAQPFAKLKVKVREEIVTLGVPTVSPELAGQHLSPEQWHELAQAEDTVILDARNKYESAIGRFQNALTPDIENFRDFPEWLEAHLAELKNKKVLMYCTGGIRCEKASALLKQKGLNEVYQLHGGIINYGKHIPNGLWLGSCFVFDERMSVPVNDPAHHAAIAQCHFCVTKTDQYYNCRNVECNALILICADCQSQQRVTCSESCAQLYVTQRQAVSEPSLT